MLRLFEPPVQSGKRNSILLREAGAGKAAAPELFNHLQTLICACTMLPGDCFDFHAPSVSNQGSRRKMYPGYRLRHNRSVAAANCLYYLFALPTMRQVRWNAAPILVFTG